MNLDNKEAKALALEVAKKSPCKKRKVGAVITDATGRIIANGFNDTTFGGPCEDEHGKTHVDVIHAEVSAIENAASCSPLKPTVIYVTHPPCEACAKAIKDAGIFYTVIVEDFMKFDAGKLRYSLIPPEMTKALAEVLTYGAKKYKPNNWKSVDDPSRYMDALYRHLEAFRSGETNDPESGLHHLSHAMTNIGFLLWIDLNSKLSTNDFDTDKHLRKIKN